MKKSTHRILYLKRAFTLAEVLITLTVIGIITAVIVPVAIHSKPDENVMKFKKAHNTLYQVVSTLINDEKYYQDGDLGILAGGNYAQKSSFCLNFADVASAKKTVCDYVTTQTYLGFLGSCWYSSPSSTKCETINFIDHPIDENCLNAQKAFSGDVLGVKTVDDIYYYEESLENFYGCIYGVDCAVQNSGWTYRVGKRLFGGEWDYLETDLGVKQYRWYKTFCIDIDGINKGEAPFGYGIRVDGKILAGKRATEWLEKSIQGE